MTQQKFNNIFTMQLISLTTLIIYEHFKATLFNLRAVAQIFYDGKSYNFFRLKHANNESNVCMERWHNINGLCSLVNPFIPDFRLRFILKPVDFVVLLVRQNQAEEKRKCFISHT